MHIILTGAIVALVLLVNAILSPPHRKGPLDK
jgi:hypothetical protein